MKLRIAIFVTSLLALPLAAEEVNPADPSLAVDQEKVSYALGMNLAIQIKSVGADVDVDALAQGIRDVLDGKPTKVQPSEVRQLFAQAQAYEMAKKKIESEAFLAKNAKLPGITVLPDGLQYRVVEAGKGEVAGTNNELVINFRGTWTDGKEFRHKEHIQIMPMNCPKGMEEALRLMKVGAKWQVFLPSELAYGQQPGRAAGFGSTLVYELELQGIGPDAAHPAEPYGIGRLGHSPTDDFLPSFSNPAPSEQSHASRELALPSQTVK